MARLFTEVRSQKLDVQCSLRDKVMLLGSCFSDSMGKRMLDAGFDVCLNPFGTLYNPASIAKAVERLGSGKPFTEEECVRMGAGAGLVCSFSHHTSFARATAQEFLENANKALAEASAFWRDCSKVVVTFGTACVWEHEKGGIVCNCLKRNESEFSHHMLGLERCSELICGIMESSPGKEFIFTVSPIRHMSQGAHTDTLSKATLHLSLQNALSDIAGTARKASYFPAWEIVCDELRDYRFYAEDLVHPSVTAENIVWERFINCAVPECDLPRIEENEKEARRRAHSPILER